MTDIIERVARAIAQAYDSAEGESWDVFRWQFEESARLAIAAMREPDEAMIRSARLAMIRDDLQPTESEIEAGWRGAIDAALSENKGESG